MNTCEPLTNPLDEDLSEEEMNKLFDELLKEDDADTDLGLAQILAEEEADMASFLQDTEESETVPWLDSVEADENGIY